MSVSYYSDEAVFSAGGVLVDEANSKVLLVYKESSDEWLLPKGHIEEGETIESAAQREVFEETGFKNEIRNLMSVQVRPDMAEPSKSKVIFWFSSILIDGDKSLDTQMADENFKGEWFSKEESLTKLRWEEDKKLVKNVFDQLL